jgi:phage-related protein
MSNLLPDYTPTRPISKSVKPRQRTAKLPSWGIEQRDTKGQNQTAPEWSVRWILAPNEANTLDTFLSAQAKTGEWFLWTPPDAAQGRFRCDDWSKQLSSCNIYEVQATFRQVFGFARPLLSGAFVGSFTLTGRNIRVLRTRIFRPVKSSFVLTGNDAALIEAELPTSTGVFVLTGNVVTLVQAQLSAATGVFALTGNDAALGQTQQVPAGPGTFALTGNDAVLGQPPQALAADTGAFALTGADVSFSLGGGSPPPSTGDEASFWSDWAPMSSDIFLYEEGAAAATGEASFWSDWASMSSDIFLYEEGAAAATGEASFWSTWQDWIEESVLLLE